MSKREIYRILDVAANRGREALRVVEDAARFLDDNQELTNALKATRHRFAAAAEKLDRRERILARDTVGDVGTTLETEDEYQRSTLIDVLTANFARLQESARSLEEFSKIVAPQLAREWERIRYDSYTLEKLAYEAATRLDEEEEAEEPQAQHVQPAMPRPEIAQAADSEAPQDEPRPLDSPVQAVQEPERPLSDDENDADANAEEEEEEEEETADEALRREEAQAEEDERRREEELAQQTAQRQPARPKERFAERNARRMRLAQTGMCAYVDRQLTDGDAADLFNSPIGIFQLCFNPRAQAESAETAQSFLKQFFSTFSGDGDADRRPLLLSRGFSVWGEAFDGGVAVDQDYRAVREEIGEEYLLGAVVSNLNEAIAALRAGQEGVLDFIEAGPVFTSQENKPAVGTAFLRAILEAVDGEPPIPIFAFGGVTPDNCVEIFDSGIERLGVGAAIIEAKNKRDAALGLSEQF